MKNIGIVLLCVLLLGALGVPAMAQEGCSLGFWKNHTGEWAATGYLSSQSVDSVFGASSAYPDLASASLEEALKFKGGSGVEGGARILLRQAVAALLNAAHPDVGYPYTVAEVTNLVNPALAGGDRDAMLLLAEDLDDDNNLGCPIDEDDTD